VIIRVGSTRPAKVEGTREALQALARVAPQFADFTLESHDLTDVAPRQPMSLAAVTDGERWGLGGGPALVLPPGVVDRVRSGAELGDVIDRMAGQSVRGSRGAWGVLTLDAIGRRDAFRLAVIAAFAPFYNSRAWGG
jgi:non-canonical (house-cleaning) NTP pyrophosphatase